MEIYLPKQITPKKRNHLKNLSQILLFFLKMLFSREAVRKTNHIKKTVAKDHVPPQEIEY
jgi:hypothetical protein